MRQRRRQRLRGRPAPSLARLRRVSGARRAWTSWCRRAELEAALRSLWAGPVQHADQGLGLRGRVSLRNGPAGQLAGRGLRPAAVQRRKLHGRVYNGRGRLWAQSPALTVTGTVAEATLSGSLLSITGAATCVEWLSSAAAMLKPLPCPGLRRAVRRQRQGNLVGCKHVLVQARRPAALPRWQPASACPALAARKSSNRASTCSKVVASSAAVAACVCVSCAGLVW